MLENIIGVNEAAELWGLKASYVKNLCAQGKVKSKKIGGKWIIDKNQENPSKVKKEIITEGGGRLGSFYY